MRRPLSDKKAKRKNQNMSSSFGQWYQDQKAQNDPSSSSSSGGGFNLSGIFGGGGQDGDTEGTLPLFSSSSGGGDGEGGSGFSMSSIKSSLESQLPQKVWGMNYQQRFRMFCMLLLLSALFFTLGFTVGLPLITIRPQKFALCFTFGSLTFMFSFAILKGPTEHFTSMLSTDRLPFTLVYITSMLLTLYFTFETGGAQGYILVLGSSALQIVALLWYLITFLPGGASGMKLLMQGMMKILTPVLIGCTKVWGMIVTKCFGWLTTTSSSSS